MKGKKLFDLKTLGELKKGFFIKRQNRFVGICNIDNKEKTCHIADPGRLKEILTEGREVLVVKNKPDLKLDYKLIAVKMEEGWILLNTSIHSKIAKKAIKEGILGFIPEKIKSEVKFGESRLDFLINEDLFVELKGSNLLFKDRCLFPDAPTQRGARHLEELIKAVEEGFKASILIMGLRECKCFGINKELDPKFWNTFKKALEKGVSYKGFKVKIDRDFNVVLNGELPLCEREKE